MQAFEITIQYSAEDLQQAYQLHYRKGYPLRGRILLILGIVSLTLGVILLAYSYFWLQFTNWFAWFLFIYGILVMAFHFWRYYTMGKRVFKRMPDFRGPYHYTFSDEGIKADGEHLHSDNTWNYYIRSLVSEDMILLYPNKYRFNFFARRHFSGEQFETLKSWVRERVLTT